jgi:hypothetical protein
VSLVAAALSCGLSLPLRFHAEPSTASSTRGLPIVRIDSLLLLVPIGNCGRSGREWTRVLTKLASSLAFD